MQNILTMGEVEGTVDFKSDVNAEHVPVLDQRHKNLLIEPTSEDKKRIEDSLQRANNNLIDDGNISSYISIGSFNTIIGNIKESITEGDLKDINYFFPMLYVLGKARNKIFSTNGLELKKQLGAFGARVQDLMSACFDVLRDTKPEHKNSKTYKGIESFINGVLGIKPKPKYNNHTDDVGHKLPQIQQELEYTETQKNKATAMIIDSDKWFQPINQWMEKVKPTQPVNNSTPLDYLS